MAIRGLPACLICPSTATDMVRTDICVSFPHEKRLDTAWCTFHVDIPICKLKTMVYDWPKVGRRLANHKHSFCSCRNVSPDQLLFSPSPRFINAGGRMLIAFVAGRTFLPWTPPSTETATHGTFITELFKLVSGQLKTPADYWSPPQKHSPCTSQSCHGMCKRVLYV